MFHLVLYSQLDLLRRCRLRAPFVSLALSLSINTSIWFEEDRHTCENQWINQLSWTNQATDMPAARFPFLSKVSLFLSILFCQGLQGSRSELSRRERNRVGRYQHHSFFMMPASCVSVCMKSEHCKPASLVACATTRVAIGGVIALLASRVLAPLRGPAGYFEGFVLDCVAVSRKNVREL